MWDFETDPEFQAEVHKVTLAREVFKGYRPTTDLFPTAHLPRLRAGALARYDDLIYAAG